MSWEKGDSQNRKRKKKKKEGGLFTVNWEASSIMQNFLVREENQGTLQN